MILPDESTPARAVEMMAHHPGGGTTINLSCGHRRWIGGVHLAPSSVFACTMSPCYKPGPEMGNR